MHRLWIRHRVWHMRGTNFCRDAGTNLTVRLVNKRTYSSSDAHDDNTSKPLKGACFTKIGCALPKANNTISTHRNCSAEADSKCNKGAEDRVDADRDVRTTSNTNDDSRHAQNEKCVHACGRCDSLQHRRSQACTPHLSASLNDDTVTQGESTAPGNTPALRTMSRACHAIRRTTDTTGQGINIHLASSNADTSPKASFAPRTTPLIVLRCPPATDHVRSTRVGGEQAAAVEETARDPSRRARVPATSSARGVHASLSQNESAGDASDTIAHTEIGGEGMRHSASRDAAAAAAVLDAEWTSDMDTDGGGPVRATGSWTVDEVVNTETSTVDFRRIDDIESDIIEERNHPEEAVVPYEDECAWKYKLMFVHKVRRTPKHLTWKELGEEMECLDCVIEPDDHRPEEVFAIHFYFKDHTTGRHDLVWSARNDVSYSEGLTDLLAAIGACLGRASVHRTIRFDDGQGTMRDVAIRTRSRYTSDVILAFRPSARYHKFERKQQEDEYAEALEKEGMSSWGFHPTLMDPEYTELDFNDPVDTYKVTLSAHGFCMIVLSALRRLLARPMRDFYRPSQLMRVAKVRTSEDVGVAHAVKGWLGIEDRTYPHYTAMEAVQEHWLGKDAPFTLCAMINKLREMAYLRPENPEFQSWLAVREHDSHVALRNMRLKMLGVGASTLFVPVTHNATVNRLLPRAQQRRLRCAVSLNAMLDLPDETRRLGEFKQLTGHERLGAGESDTAEESAGKGER